MKKIGTGKWNLLETICSGNKSIAIQMVFKSIRHLLFLNILAD